MRPVIVFDGARPWIRLLSWFVHEAGCSVTRCPDEAAVIAALATQPRALVVVNALDNNAALRHLSDAVRDRAPDARIAVLRPQPHEPGEAPLSADICIHAIAEPQTAVDAILYILRTEE